MPRCAPKCPSDESLLAPVERTLTTIILNLKPFYRNFLLHTAGQLYCGAGGALGCSVVPSIGSDNFTCQQKVASRPNVSVMLQNFGAALQQQLQLDQLQQLLLGIRRLRRPPRAP